MAAGAVTWNKGERETWGGLLTTTSFRIHAGNYPITRYRPEHREWFNNDHFGIPHIRQQWTHRQFSCIYFDNNPVSNAPGELNSTAQDLITERDDYLAVQEKLSFILVPLSRSWYHLRIWIYFWFIFTLHPMLRGSLSPQHGVSSGCRWRIRPLRMEGSCEYIEQTVAESRQGVVLQLGCRAKS
jgi:hypothetical protein